MHYFTSKFLKPRLILGIIKRLTISIMRELCLNKHKLIYDRIQLI